MNELLTVDEVAQALRCSRRRVFELLADGTLARGARYGRRTVITAESVRAALEAPVPEQPKPRTRRSTRASLDAQADAILAEVRARPRGAAS